jgi:cytokinin dehydrogenase
MNNAPSRRNALRMAASPALIIGFNAATRSWVTQALAEQASLQTLPKLDGLLLQDEASRQAIAIDGGNIFHRIPAAVLEPGSIQDVVTMVRYANEHALKIVMKGQGHSRYGQTQAEAGIVGNSATLNNVQPLLATPLMPSRAHFGAMLPA